MRNPIVILGGMGPQASLRFHQLLIEKSLRYHHGAGSDFPHIVHFSLPVDDFISDEAAEQATVQALNHLAPVIRRLRPGQITLACNTAHVLIKDVGILQRPPFVSMLEVVARKLQQDGIRRVGLLASPTTIRTGLYEDVLAQDGIATTAPTPKQRRQLEDAIRAVITGGAGAKEQRELAPIAQSLTNRGAEAILLGCTELPLIFPLHAAKVPVYDCLDLYAEAVIANHYCIMEK